MTTGLAALPGRWSIRLNNDLAIDAWLGLTMTAERLGFDQVWLSNDLLLRSAETMVALAIPRTTRVALGIGILNPYTRHPAEIAMTAATLAAASRDRFHLGLAAGANEFLEWVGLEHEAPLATTRRAIEGIRCLLEGDPPPPGWQPDLRVVPAGRVPLYLGAMGPRMLSLAGELADGVLALRLPPSRFAETVSAVDRGLAVAGRSRHDIDLPLALWVSVDDDPTAARAALADKLAYYGSAFSPDVLAAVGLGTRDLRPARLALDAGDPDRARRLVPDAALRLGLSGGVDEVARQLAELLAHDVTHVSFGPPLGPRPRHALELLASQVVPRAIALGT